MDATPDAVLVLLLLLRAMPVLGREGTQFDEERFVQPCAAVADMASQGKNQSTAEDNIVGPIADGREYQIHLGETFTKGVESSKKLFHTLQCK